MTTTVRRFAIVLFVFATVVSAPRAFAQEPRTFASPEDAANALMSALGSNDDAQLLAIFGAQGASIVSSGDPQLDKHQHQLLYLAMKQSWRWTDAQQGRKELVVGDEAFPFAVPLMRSGALWRYDVEGGKLEVLARRIGRNELKAIAVARTYVAAQRAYAREGRDGKPAGVYAQRVRSAAGLHDGLYWPAPAGEPLSPLGDLAAQAAQDGYDREASGPSAPLYGYYFRILTSQGGSAPGGATNYVVNGAMTGGFALIAYPAKYGDSGIMTFIVNQSGVVFEKDLGVETAKIAATITSYNPDASWREAR
jgi:hypothetical protein